MPREHPDFRDNMELLNQLFPTSALLELRQVQMLTGWKDIRTIKKRLPVIHEQVSKVALAKYLCSGG